MRIFKTKWFECYARRERIEDRSLREAIIRAEQGLVDADLGGNVIKRSLGKELMQEVSKHLHRSIQYSMENREDALAYAMQFARDMQPELADRFVAMWVNDLTLDYGERGREAVKRLLAEGYKAGIIKNKVKIDFVDQ